MIADYADVGRMYGECILYWVLENAVNLDEVNEIDMQEGSGLSDVQFQIGLEWLIRQDLLERPAGQTLQ